MESIIMLYCVFNLFTATHVLLRSFIYKTKYTGYHISDYTEKCRKIKRIERYKKTFLCSLW